MSKSKASRAAPVTFASAARDVLIHSLNKGQFPFACLAALLALTIFKMPAQDVSTFADRILRAMTTMKGASYTLNGLLAWGWFFHARWQRKSIAEEMERIGREKTELQEQKLGVNLSTSNKVKS